MFDFQFDIWDNQIENQKFVNIILIEIYNLI